MKTTEQIVEAMDKEPRWVPVSERLPDPQKDGDTNFSEWLLITLNNGKNNKTVIRAYYCFSTQKWYGDRLAIGEVIAWMSLPKPYKAESDMR